MSDKPLVQQALATEIAGILLTIPKASSSLAFLRGFWESLVREWGGIDYLRYVHALIEGRQGSSTGLQDRQVPDARSAVCERVISPSHAREVGCVRLYGV